MVTPAERFDRRQLTVSARRARERQKTGSADGTTARPPNLQQALDILLRAGIIPLTQSRIVHSFLYGDDQRHGILFDIHKHHGTWRDALHRLRRSSAFCWPDDPD